MAVDSLIGQLLGGRFLTAIHLVASAKPSPCPAELRRAYEALELLPRKAE